MSNKYMAVSLSVRRIGRQECEAVLGVGKKRKKKNWEKR